MRDRFSVVVIGGGIVGASSLFHLTEQGCDDVALVERTQIGAGSTSKAIGGIRNVFSHPLTIETANRCIDFYRDFEDNVGTSLDLDQSGYLYLCHSPSVLEEWAERKHVLDDFGVSSSLLSPTAAKDRFPPLEISDLEGAFFGHDCSHLDPYTAARGFAKAAEDAGAVIHTDTSVEGLLVDDGVIEGVATSVGEIYADHVICAAGPWTKRLAESIGIDLPIELSARRIAVTEPVVQGNSPLVIDRDLGCYFRTEPNGSMLLCDTERDITGFDDPDSIGTDEVGFDYLLHALSKIERLVPHITDKDVLNGWIGVQTTSPDGHPILGPTGIDGFSVACGFNGLGVMMAPVYGQTLATNALNDRAETVDLHRLTVGRFDPSRGVRIDSEELA